MPKPAPRELEVIRTTPVTPHMLRVTLGGDNMAQFPTDQASAYIKLVFPRGEGQRPMMRTYTIRHQRADEIDVDFMVHDTEGPASSWAQAAQPGDRILIGGPGARKLVDPEADWFLLAGDMTALPAMSVNLELMPADARGYAVIEVVDEADIQELDHPENVELHWVVNPTPDADGQTLLNRVRQLAWLDGEPSVWAACEFTSMRNLRKHFKQEKEVGRRSLYVSSYWKIGVSEDEHKLAKSRDAETAGA
ncbi:MULTISPECIES: siderophore-interacting protein [Marinobacter]|uniref:siderophore-interacting protein n=1 Tax=Marinobacter TaxID=2742 RepID=UPI000DAE27FA|nr:MULTISPECIES: siderophore-interacting protein [Marinobacter]